MEKREMTKVQLFLNITGETEEFGSIKNRYRLEKYIPSEVLADMSVLDILGYKASDYEDGEKNGTKFDEFRDSHHAETARGCDGGYLDWSIAPSFFERLYFHSRYIEERDAFGKWHVTMTVQTKEIVIHHYEADYEGRYCDAVIEPYGYIFGNIITTYFYFPNIYKPPHVISGKTRLYDFDVDGQLKKATDRMKAAYESLREESKKADYAELYAGILAK